MKRAAVVVALLILAASCSAEPAPTTSTSTTTSTTTTTTLAPTTTTTTTLPPRTSTPKAFVAGLIVSMGEPTQDEIEQYQSWNANAVALWEPEEAVHWPLPAYVWVTHSGHQIDEPHQKEDPATWQPLTLPPNVFAVQVGDEPIPPEIVDTYPLYRPIPDRLTLPPGVTQFTNWSYWTPMTINAMGMEPTLDAMFELYNGDVVTNGEYTMNPETRYTVLNYFRTKALERGQPYWQYLNGYVGNETNFERVHTESDLAWQAFSGAAMGYSGHIWFTYAIGLGHTEFDGNNNGSVITAHSGEHTPDVHWQTTADINAELLRLTRQLIRHTSTDVCWADCAFPATEPTLQGEFHDANGNPSWVIVNSNHTYTGSDAPAEVTIPFDAVLTFPQRQTVAAGETVTIPAGHAIRAEVVER